MKQTIGERLRAWREHRGLTQREAAALAELCQSQWCLFETGRCIPSSHKAIRSLIAVTRGDPGFALRLSMFDEALSSAAA